MRLREPFDRISSEPGKLGGPPCIRGLRIAVRRVLEIPGTCLRITPTWKRAIFSRRCRSRRRPSTAPLTCISTPHEARALGSGLARQSGAASSTPRSWTMRPGRVEQSLLCIATFPGFWRSPEHPVPQLSLCAGNGCARPRLRPHTRCLESPRTKPRRRMCYLGGLVWRQGSDTSTKLSNSGTPAESAWRPMR